MIRPVRPSDAAAICRVYNHYVLHTVVSFEEEAVAPEEMARRIEAVAAAGLPWLVLEEEGRLIGYAYATLWKTRWGTAMPWRARSTWRRRPGAKDTAPGCTPSSWRS